MQSKQKAKGIWRRLHRMTPRTRHAAYGARAAADLSRVTDRQTDANIGNNSQHLMHSMQPITRCRSPGSFASAWPDLIIACGVRERGLLQTDRKTDTTTGLHIASFAFIGVDAKNSGYNITRRKLRVSVYFARVTKRCSGCVCLCQNVTVCT